MTSLKQLYDKAAARSYERRVKKGKVGKINPVGPPTFAVEGRADFLWVTLSDKNVIQARNEAGVPQEVLPVKLIVFNGDHIIIGRDTSGSLAVPTPTPPSGVLPHVLDEHTDVVITAAASGDVLAHNGTNWVDETPLTTSAGAGDAGKLVRLNASGEVDSTMLPAGIDPVADQILAAATDDTIADTDIFGYVTGTTLVKTAWSNIKAVLAAAVMTLTNKTLDSTNIGSLTAKNPPIDADSAVIVDSADADKLKRVTYTNIKAFLKTHFDTFYGLLAGTNLWTGTNTFRQAALTLFQRTTALTTNALAVMTLKTETTGVMADGFGTGIHVQLRDDSAVDNDVGLLLWQRLGADDTSQVLLYVYNAGVATNVARWTAAGMQSPTLITPVIASFASAIHDHTNAAGGGQIPTGGLLDEAVTLAKLQHIATDTLLGRATAGTGDVELITLTAFARTLIDDIDAAAGRTTLGLGTMAVENVGDWVSIAGTQTVTGAKTFTGTFSVEGTNSKSVVRTGAANNLLSGAFNLRTETATPMVDGFGTGFIYQGKDDDATTRTFGITGARRDGADDTSELIGYAYLAGAAKIVYVMKSNRQVFLNELESGNATSLGIRPGTSTNDAAVGGVLYVDSTQRANGTTVETDLASYNVPANTLSVNRQSIWCHAWGTIVNNGNTKTLKLYFGADVWTVATIVVGVTAWSVKARIVRTSATAQKIVIEIHTGTSSNTIVSTAARTLSIANLLKFTGQSSAASNEVTQEAFMVGWSDNNT